MVDISFFLPRLSGYPGTGLEETFHGGYLPRLSVYPGM